MMLAGDDAAVDDDETYQVNSSWQRVAYTTQFTRETRCVRVMLAFV